MGSTTNSDSGLRKMMSGAAITFSFSILGFILAFFFKLFIARFFSVPEVGEYNLIETIFSILVVLAALGIPEGITRFLPIYKIKKKFDLLKGYLNFAFLVPLVFSLIIALLTFFLSSHIASLFNVGPVFTMMLKVASFAFPFRIANSLFRAIFFAEKKALYPGIAYNVIEKLVLFIGVFIVYFSDLSILYLVYFFVLSIVLSAIYCVIVYFFKISLPESSSAKYKTKDWILFSLPLLLSGIFSYILSWTDNFVIGIFLESYSLGIYSTMYSFASLLIFFQISLGVLFLPTISELYASKKRRKIRWLFKKINNYGFILTSPLFFILLFYSKPLIDFIYGSAFVPGSNILILLSFAFLIVTSLSNSDSIIKLHKNTKYLFYVNIILAGVNILLNILFIHLFGLIGVALASFVTIISQRILLFLKARSYEKIGVDFVVYSKAILANLFAVGLTYLVFQLPFAAIAKFISMFVAYALSYYLLSRWFGALKKEDMTLFQSLLLRKR